jgi:adenylate cyclase
LGKLAVALNPNGAEAYFFLGGIVGALGRWEENVLYITKSIRLNPVPLIGYYWFLGRAYFMMGQYDEAIVALRKALQMNRIFYLPTLILRLVTVH